MPDAEAYSAERIARPYIEQCRRDIEAAWLQIDAARELLRRSHWLFRRWQAHTPRASADEAGQGG